MEEQSAPRPKRKYTRRQPLTPKPQPAPQGSETVEQLLDSLPPSQGDYAQVGLPPPPPMPPRPAVRPEVRAEDPRAAALRRAQEIRGHGVQIALEDTGHAFDVDLSTIPPGWYYEWKTYTVYGARDPDSETNLRLRGWTPVPAARHPELVPLGTPPDAPVIKKGLMLMEIPSIIADERKADLDRLARNRVREKEAQLSSTPAGSLERTTDPRVHKINKTIGYEQPIPLATGHPTAT